MTVTTREANETSWKLTVIPISVAFGVWLFSLINIPALSKVATIYLIMNIATVILVIATYISDNKHPFGIFGFPLIREIPLPLAAGVTYGIAFLLLGFGALSLTYFFSVASPFITLAPLELYILYGIFTPITEDTLLQATLLPILANATHLKTLAIALVTTSFGAIHYLYFGGSLVLIATSAVFYVGASILTLHFRTALASLAAHIAFNTIITYLFLTAPITL